MGNLKGHAPNTTAPTHPPVALLTKWHSEKGIEVTKPSISGIIDA
jgi:hypothetical protein